MINYRDFDRLIKPVDCAKEVPKIAHVLHFLARGGTLNRFEAERKVHDHALNSTISELASNHDISVLREQEAVPNWEGNKVWCKRYSIDPAPDNMRRCYELLCSAWGFTRRPAKPSLAVCRTCG